ncbi:MAG: 1-pyrroline-5-carboxylate dehydrogenase [Firmicutes bacterium ADurb.Bin262]|nr:MAG: 1-pyrroline-5-carboxylate dehydrogenase [Firmicutes bacterium ADurb.Bin262]
MNNGYFKVREFHNEPSLGYYPAGAAKQELLDTLASMRNGFLDIPLIIGGREIRTGKTKNCIIPHDKDKVIGCYHEAGGDEIQLAIDAANKAKKIWAEMPYDQRMLVFLKAAHLASTTWRARLNAATMLCQSKTFYQADIDSACELIDFYNINCKALCDIYDMQPAPTKDSINKVDYRPLDGFVFAVTPFNFTAIASNLPSAPAIAGNTVVWKPASSAVYSAYMVMKLWQEAGLPDGVINFIPGNARMVSDIVFNSEDLAGVHFTGSTEVFNSFWKKIGDNIGRYKCYPRIVGETGGKNYIMVHPSADADRVVAAIIRGAFEYQGQKCSATSRGYIPQSRWLEIKEKLAGEIATIKMGNAEEPDTFVSAVIDRAAFDKNKRYLEYIKASPDAEIICGGGCDDTKGFFVEPTVVLTSDPAYKTMTEEIFGPIITLYVYEDERYEEMLDVCANASEYGLTGAFHATSREAIDHAEKVLRFSAGNLYINDKSTGSVVNQNPFGGSRASGTNDKAGSFINMLKWVSPLAIKDSYNAAADYRY